MEISDGTYILVLRYPLDAIVSGIVHHHIKTGEPIIDYAEALSAACQHYIKHLNSYDLSKVSVYDFNDLVSNPMGLLSTIVDIKHSPLIYPGNLEGSLKDYELYQILYEFAKKHAFIFKPANKVYQEALKYRYVIL
jgi:hypothetical protein